VSANLLAAAADIAPGTVLNVSGGGATTVSELLDLVGDAVGTAVPVDRKPEQAGDVQRTDGCTDALTAATGWAPDVGIADGIRSQVAWQRQLHARA
jgi:nucleoside-diphosphate-sugar epimerase